MFAIKSEREAGPVLLLFFCFTTEQDGVETDRTRRADGRAGRAAPTALPILWAIT